jgi:cell division protein FtsB
MNAQDGPRSIPEASAPAEPAAGDESPSLPGQTPRDEGVMANDDEGRANDQKQPPEEAAIVRWTKILGVFQIVLAFGAIVSNVIAYGQLTVTRQQLAEIQSSSQQTEKLVNSNADLAAAAKTQAEAQAKSAETAQKALTLSQRALISVQMVSVQPIQEGSGPKISLMHMNSGREPAPLDTLPYFKIMSKDDFKTIKGATHILEMRRECMGILDVVGRNVAYPGISYTANWNTNDDFFDDSLKVVAGKGLINGDDVLIVTSCFPYRTMNEMHHVFACYFYNAKTTATPVSLNICEIGNDAD